MKALERRIVLLVLDNGRAPFTVWFERLSVQLQRAVDARLTRVAVGNFGDHKSVGAGVFELRIMKGSGLRVYYGLKGADLVVLIGSGDKASQKKDLVTGKSLWRRFNAHQGI